MASQGGGDNTPLSEQISEPGDGPTEPVLDAPPHASADNPTAAGLSVKMVESSKPREAFNREMYRIPSYAGWFSWGKIHAIERRALPEFFDGYSLSKTPKVYKEYREFIINKYRENSRRALTFTEVRKMLVGDVNLLRKVFDFLEYWGLINYHTTSENKQQQQQQTISNGENKEMVAEGIVTEESENTTAVAIEAKPPSVPDSALTSSQAQPAVKSPEQPSSMLQSTQVALQNDVLSPINTPKEGLDDSKHPAAGNDWLGSWTLEEVLRLLEAIRKFGEDWNRVAAHVGTKSRLDCVIRFIKLPFGDQFTSNIGDSHHPITIDYASGNKSQVGGQEHKGNQATTSSLDGNSTHEHCGADEVINEPPSKRLHISPLADSSNPILAQVAFLSAMVGPRVSAAAAQAAITALADEDAIFSQALQTGIVGHNVHANSQAASVKAEDAESETAVSGKAWQNQASKDADTSVAHVRGGISAALGAVAANAKLLADQEERDVEHIMADLIDNQFRKLQSKVDHYEELEFILEKEHAQLEKARLQVLGDWIRYSQYHYNAGPS